MLRWFVDGTRLAQLAADSRIGVSPAYRYLHGGIGVLAGAARRAAGRPRRRAPPCHRRRHPDRPDRLSTPGPTCGWTCGGAASTPITAATSKSSPLPTAGRWGPRLCGPAASTTPPPARPPDLLPLLAEWTAATPTVLADLGYEGEADLLHIPIKRTVHAPRTDDQRTLNAGHAATRALAERGNTLLKTTFKALHQVSLCPWRIGAITAAALVLPHHQHGHTP